MIFMFILFYEFFVVSKYDEMNWNIFSRIFYNTFQLFEITMNLYMLLQ
jgi:hypothetical protein